MVVETVLSSLLSSDNMSPNHVVRVTCSRIIFACVNVLDTIFEAGRIGRVVSARTKASFYGRQWLNVHAFKTRDDCCTIINQTLLRVYLHGGFKLALNISKVISEAGR